MVRMSIAEEARANRIQQEEFYKVSGGTLIVPEEEGLKQFWDEMLHLPADVVPVRVNREHFLYHLDKDGNIDEGGSFKGFGGRRWDIEFFDGRRVTTHNLWYQGRIPTDYDESLPDNARFIDATNS